jgi:peptidoglycan LD-endopeptidase LytH
MRAKMAGIFALGFACGVLLLTLALWFSGGLRISSVIAGSHPVVSPAATAPVSKLESTPVPAGGAITPPPIHVAMPIAGVDPEELQDTFNEIHAGHKHEALDIPAPRGTPVLAVAEGNVVKLFNSKQGGITVYQFDNTQTYCYYYAHLDRYAPALRENTLLRKGDVLGYVGSTGNAGPDAPHLHFAVSKLGPDKKWWEGTPIDPLPLLK